MSEPTRRARIETHDPATRRVNQPRREEAVVRKGEEPIVHERPEEWGWHGEMGRWGRRLWIIPFALMIAFQFGNHRGHVETIWLACLTLLLPLIALYDWRRRKNAWRSE